MSVPERRAMVERPGETLSVRRQCVLLNLARSGVYRSGPVASADDLALMRRIDELHLKWPFYGSQRMVFELNQAGHGINRKRVQRLMRVMGNRGAGSASRHQQGRARPQDLSLSAARRQHHRAQSCLGQRHHLYPLHHRADAPPTYISPVVRRRLPTTVSTPFNPEPAIDEPEYQNILRIIENMFMMERSPKVFSKAPEETIRDHYLVQLNGQYEGSATGETFNSEGKSDILVRDGSANLFIAECKVWHGEKKFIEAIDQLFRYVTWRDTKTAIIVFNRNQDTTGVVQTIKTAIEGHASYKRGSQLESDTRLRSVFGRPDDPTREAIVTVLVVPIPKAA
jgi:hypothetical protein